MGSGRLWRLRVVGLATGLVVLGRSGATEWPASGSPVVAQAVAGPASL